MFGYIYLLYKIQFDFESSVLWSKILCLYQLKTLFPNIIWKERLVSTAKNQQLIINYITNIDTHTVFEGDNKR